MTSVRLTAAQWIQRYQRGRAAIVQGRRHTLVIEKQFKVPVVVQVELLDRDPRCDEIDNGLDAEDLTRLLTGFRGLPDALTPPMRYMRTAEDGNDTAYVVDEDSGMVFILD